MAKQPRSLAGKVAVVTGGGRGIGKAVSHSLAREGVRVAIADLDGAVAEQAATEVGGGAIGLTLDVTDRPAFTAALDDIEGRLGPIDVLVNNAGIMPIGPFEEETDATAIRQLELNLHAVIHGSKEAMRRMKPRGTGHIVNVASIAGKFGAPGGATYSACKHGVVGLSESIRGELYGTGVEVHVVMPAFVSTELIAGTNALKGVKRQAPEDVAEAVVDALKFGRFEVFVPKSIKGLVRSAALSPRSFFEWLGRKIGGEALLEADKGARAAYEQRAAKSAPAAEAVVAETAADDEPKTPAAA
ncbi:MAG TPA: SDR family oxidoreductase [Solirubrobacteraceae bacterium]|nr:SDR family oxidoreductase [Solirubrobacteraceae bacterium]